MKQEAADTLHAVTFVFGTLAFAMLCVYGVSI